MSTGFGGAKLILALALVLPGPVLAAGFTCAQPAESGADGAEKTSALDELEEVVVTGGKPNESTRDLRAWPRRLVGQYRYEGYVDLCGSPGILRRHTRQMPEDHADHRQARQR